MKRYRALSTLVGLTALGIAAIGCSEPAPPRYGVQRVGRMEAPAACRLEGSDRNMGAVVSFRGPRAGAGTTYAAGEDFVFVEPSGATRLATCFRLLASDQWRPTLQVRNGALVSEVTSHSTADYEVELLYNLQESPTTEHFLIWRRGEGQTDTLRITNAMLSVSSQGSGGENRPRRVESVRFQAPAGEFDADTATIDGQSRVVAKVSPAFFGSTRPMLGRDFVSEERNSQAAVSILSHAYWVSALSEDPTVIGRNIRVGERAVLVVGVMPPGVDTPKDVAIWLPRGK